MDTFEIGWIIENLKLPIPLKGIVNNPTPIEKMIGNRFVRKVRVSVEGMELEWLCENVRLVSKPTPNIVPEPVLPLTVAV